MASNGQAEVGSKPEISVVFSGRIIGVERKDSGMEVTAGEPGVGGELSQDTSEGCSREMLERQRLTGNGPSEVM